VLADPAHQEVGVQVERRELSVDALELFVREAWDESDGCFAKVRAGFSHSAIIGICLGVPESAHMGVSLFRKTSSGVPSG
jgi:hypothetical protein